MRKLLPILPLLLLAGCGRGPAGGRRIDPALAALAPGDAVLLAGIHMDQLRVTPLYRKLAANPRLDASGLWERYGFDPRRDVTELLVASDGKDTVVAARGAFKPNIPPSTPKTEYKGRTIYGGEQGGFAILDPSTAVAGKLSSVRAAIDRQSARGAPPALLSRASAIPAANQVWLVSSGSLGLPIPVPQGSNLENFAKMIRALEDITAMADFRQGVKAEFTGNCLDERNAELLESTVRGMVGLGRLTVPENQPELLRVYDGIKVERKGRSVRITADAPEEPLEKLVDRLSQGFPPSPRLP